MEDVRGTAAVVPSSRELARAMVAPLRNRPQRVIVEFGPGTGVITRELLALLPPDGMLLAFEISPRFVNYLRETIQDSRLRLVAASAETASTELRQIGISQIDAVVSSLGVTLMDSDSADAIFRPLVPHLADRGIITQYQYVSRVRVSGGRVERFDVGSFLERYFHAVTSRLVLMNIPPAFVFTCSGVRHSVLAQASGQLQGRHRNRTGSARRR